MFWLCLAVALAAGAFTLLALIVRFWFGPDPDLREGGWQPGDPPEWRR